MSEKNVQPQTNRTSFKIIFALILIFFTYGLLEIVSYISLSPEEKKVKPGDLMRLQSNEMVEGRGQRYGCSFSETTIGHPMLGFVHRRKEFLTGGCLKENGPKGNNIMMNSYRDFPIKKNDDEFVIMVLGGSVAFMFTDYHLSENPYFEDYLNKHYLPPKKKVFKVYPGAAGAWAMPNQVNMFLMYGERVDGVVSIDGYNEVFPVQEKRRLEQIPAGQFILSNTPNSSWRFTYMNTLWLYRSLVAKTWLKHSYFFNVVYKVLVGFLQKVVISESLREEFSRGNSEQLDSLPFEEREDWVVGSLERYMLRLHDLGRLTNVLTAEFLQPTRLMGKDLTEEEKLPIEYIDPKAYARVRETYLGLEKKGYPVRDLTYLFKDEKGTIYSDHIHYKWDIKDGSRGNELMAKAIGKHLESMWGIKPR